MAILAALVRASVYGAALALATGCILLPLDAITEDAPSEPDSNDDEPTDEPSARPTPSTPSEPPDVCVPECSQAQCGDDGCGDVCGECDTTLEECVSGACLFQTGVYANCTCDSTTANIYDVVPEALCASGYASIDVCVDESQNPIVCSLDDNGYPFYQWTEVCL